MVAFICVVATALTVVIPCGRIQAWCHAGLLSAVDRGDLAEVRLRLRWGPDESDQSWTNPVLYEAAAVGNDEIVMLLIEVGHDVNMPMKMGPYPVDAAQRNGHASTVDLLREHGGLSAREIQVRRPVRKPKFREFHCALGQLLYLYVDLGIGEAARVMP